jgi:transposase-like protein
VLIEIRALFKDTRSKFSRESKLDTVKMAKDRGVALKQVALDLDFNENMLRRWIRGLDEEP